MHVTHDANFLFYGLLLQEINYEQWNIVPVSLNLENIDKNYVLILTLAFLLLILSQLLPDCWKSFRIAMHFLLKKIIKCQGWYYYHFNIKLDSEES